VELDDHALAIGQHVKRQAIEAVIAINEGMGARVASH
jgi:hypothetical protein